MTPGNDLPDPLDIVAQALCCSRAAISIESAMYRDHGWDSFGHVRVIVALETAYGIHIDDDAIEKYTTMRAIQQLYEQVRDGGQHGD